MTLSNGEMSSISRSSIDETTVTCSPASLDQVGTAFAPTSSMSRMRTVVRAGPYKCRANSKLARRHLTAGEHTGSITSPLERGLRQRVRGGAWHHRKRMDLGQDITCC